MRLHVTGGSGFLGSHVVPLLLAAGHEVSALSRSPRSDRRLAELGAVVIRGDLGSPESVDRAFAASQADALVNLASLGSGHAPTLVAAAEEAGLRRAVFVSSTAIFTSLDAASKAVRVDAEAHIRSSALEWTILRPTMIYGGAGDRNMARLLGLLRHRLPVLPLPGGGQALQQPVHVGDVARAVVSSLAARGAVGKAYDLAGPEPLTLRQVVEQAAAVTGRSPRLVALPLGPAVAVMRLYGRVARDPRIRAEQVARLGEDKSFDIGGARRDLEFSPRSFADGIGEELQAVLANGQG